MNKIDEMESKLSIERFKNLEVQNFMDLKIGLSVHWGPASLGGKEISWSRGRKFNGAVSIPKEDYDSLYKRFNPDLLDTDEWCELAKRWGMRYIAPTSKHHDGFCLWKTDSTFYNAGNTPGNFYLLANLSKSCKKYDITLGTYYGNEALSK